MVYRRLILAALVTFIPFQAKAVATPPNCPSNGTNALTYTTSNNAYACSTISSGSGSGIPGTVLGILAQTTSGNFSARTLSGTTSEITITNGDGISGNPTISIASGYLGQTSITTLGTITTGTWNGTAIANANLAHSSITFGTTSISLGNSATAIVGLASLSYGGSLTTGSVLDMSSVSSSMIMPTGTTGQRPTGVAGMVRYNSTTPTIEAYYNNAWNSLGGGSSGVSSISGDGTYISNSASTGAVTLTTNFSTAALATIGTSGNTVPKLNAANTWSALQTVTSGDFALTSTTTGVGIFNGTGVLAGVATLGNSFLTNSSVTIGNTAISLGSSATAITGLASVSFGSSLTSGSSLDMSNTTNSFILPTGTTGQRPTGVAGMLRYNSTTPGLEAYYNSTWNALGSGGGSGITALTGQVIASGSGSVAATIQSIGAISPFPGITTDTSGTLYQAFYTGAGGNAAPSDFGWTVKASPSADTTLQLRFPMPPLIPAGTFKLRSLCLANAATGAIKYTVNDAMVAPTASPSAASLTAETQTTVTWTTGGNDKYTETKTTLTPTAIGNDMSVVAIVFNHTSWTLAQPVTCIWTELFE